MKVVAWATAAVGRKARLGGRQGCELHWGLHWG